jgi:hypothetical protein
LVKRNRHRPPIQVIADGRDIVSHAGARLLGDLSDRLGLTDGLSEAMAPTKHRRRGHDRREVLVDLAAIVASGGEAISDLAVLRNQPRLFGEVVSNPTAWRTWRRSTRTRSPASRAHEPLPGPQPGNTVPTRALV